MVQVAEVNSYEEKRVWVEREGGSVRMTERVRKREREREGDSRMERE